MTRASLLYLASFGVHAALAASVASLKGTRTYEDVSVAVVEHAKPEPARAAPPPPLAPPEAPTAAARAKRAAPRQAAPPRAEAAPPPPAAGPAGGEVPDFGLALGGATGGAGLALPAAGPRSEAAPAPTVAVSRKLLAAPAPAPTGEACAEPPVKPKVLSITQPAYTPEAREASVAGRVRVELTVDATGRVSSARVLEGLGHGLDEAALAAARAAIFEPGTRCGKAAPATFVIAMRFAL